MSATTALILMGILVTYVALGVVWALRRRDARGQGPVDYAAIVTIEQLSESHPHFQAVFAGQTLVLLIANVAIWPYLEWKIREEAEAFAGEDARILETMADEFRALSLDERIAILRRCSPGLIRALRDRFQED